MTEIEIFGKPYSLIDQISNRDQVELKDNELRVYRHWKSSKELLQEFLSQILYEKLEETSKGIELEEKIGLLGNLDFEIKEKIDNKTHRIAKLKGNKIIVKLNAVALPESVLRYIIAHELAHITVKQHTPKFWKTVEIICPEYKKAQQFLLNKKL